MQCLEKLNEMWENRHIRLVTAKGRINSLVLEPKCHTTKFFTKTLLAIETRKMQIHMNNLVYLGLSIVDLSETVMY